MSTQALIAVAESAQDTAAGLNKFLDAVPDCSTEITGLISECFAISSALRELSNAINDPLYYRNFDYIREDLRTVVLSLRYTFDDVKDLFGGLGRATYRQVWGDFEDFFYDESSNTLMFRLEYYRQFLLGLTRSISRTPFDENQFEILHYRIKKLLELQQERRLVDDVNNASLEDRGIPKPRSFERNRPPPPPFRAPSPISPPLERRRYPYGPQSPLSPGFDQEYFDYLPPAPEAPISPATTNTYSSQSSGSNSSVDHWVYKVFTQHRSTTAFKSPGQVSACYGYDIPQASTRLTDDNHSKILQLTFEEGDLLVRLYYRPKDHRARIYCRSLRPNRSRRETCLPLPTLTVKREASNLIFTVTRGGKPLDRWLTLRFMNYEKLVLFFCTFLALRSHDNGTNPIKRITDEELRGEKSIMAGVIIDDGFEHQLQLLKDRDTGVIRLQASVLRKELKKTPVWTAFITHQVTSRTWMKKVDSTTIHLTELQQFIFTAEYSPQLGPGGEHELCFDHPEATKGFMRAIDLLRRHEL